MKSEMRVINKVIEDISVIIDPPACQDWIWRRIKSSLGHSTISIEKFKIPNLRIFLNQCGFLISEPYEYPLIYGQNGTIDKRFKLPYNLLTQFLNERGLYSNRIISLRILLSWHNQIKLFSSSGCLVNYSRNNSFLQDWHTNMYIKEHLKFSLIF